MTMFLEKYLPEFLHWLLTSTIQVSILVAIILAIKAIARDKLTPRWQYCLWMILIVRILTPWTFNTDFSVFNLLPSGQTTQSHTQPTEKIQASPDSLARDSAVVIKGTTPTAIFEEPTLAEKFSRTSVAGSGNTLAIIWLAGAAVLAGYILFGYLKLWYAVKVRRPLTSQSVLDLLEDCKQQLAVHTILGVVVTDKISTPALFGFLRPRLLLPAGLIDRIDYRQLRYIFMHELAHLKRHDISIGWLVAICQVIHWFNPLVWLAFWFMRNDRELACDSLALSNIEPDESSDYGRAIVGLLENFSRRHSMPCLAAVLEDKSQLKRRITMIAKFKKGSYKLSLTAAALLAILSCVALTDAQETPTTKDKTPQTLAQEFVQLLTKEKFAEATQNFDTAMKTALPADKLGQTWKSIVEQAGPFGKQLGTRTEKYMDLDIVYVTCELEKGPLDVKMVYGKDKKVTGLWFVPTPEDVLKSYREQASKVDVNPIKKTGPSRGSVTFVLGANGQMTFEGEKTTLDKMPSLLEQVPDKADTILAFAVADRSLSLNEVDPAKGELMNLSKKLNFKYFSYIGEHPLGSYSISNSRFHEKLRNNITVDIDNSPQNERLTVQYAVIAICEKAGIPYQWEKSAGLADPQRRNFIEPLHIKNISMEKALLDVLTPVGLRYDLDEKGLYLYRPTDVKNSADKNENTVTPIVVSEADKLAAEDLMSQGWALWRERKLLQAEEKFSQATQKDPANDGAYQGLGWAQFNQGKKLNAKESFEKCVQINPKNSAALNGLGWLAHGQGNIDEAIQWWEKAVTASNGVATASLSGLAQVYMERKEYDKAAKYYQMWLDAEPQDKQAKDGLEKAKQINR